MEKVPNAPSKSNDSRTKDAMLRDRGHKPPALDVIPEDVPADLRDRPQWCCWGWRWKPDAKKPENSQWGKTPFRADGRGLASSTDPQTWTTFDAALAAYRANRDKLDGLFFVFTCGDPFCGGDLDSCRDRMTGELDPKAVAEVQAWDTFAEVSPTSTGIKLVGKGTMPGGHGRKRGDYEAYSQARFWAITGHRLPDAPATVNNCQNALNQFIAKYIDPPKPEPKPSQPRRPEGSAALPDDDLLDRIRRSDQGDTFKRLYDDGDTSGYKSHSEADLALCDILAFWTGGDADRMDRLFRGSKLDREKWTRADYRSATIKKALEGRTEFYTPGGPHADNGKADTAPTADEPKTGVQVIREYFDRRYRPQFRIGNSIRTLDGRDVLMGEACAVPDSKLIAALAGATDAPAYVNGGKRGDVKWASLPNFFKTWAKVAWGDLLTDLRDEDDADLAVLGTARDEFRRWVRDAMLSEVTLGETKKADRLTETNVERNSLIGWCDRFAKPGPWRRIRGKLCWCRRVEHEGGELELQVAVKHGLFGQVKADPKLRAMTEWKFTRRAKNYAVGTSTRECRPHGESAVLLARDFVEDLIATPAETPEEETAEEASPGDE
jgi:hypothetical protein